VNTHSPGPGTEEESGPSARPSTLEAGTVYVQGDDGSERSHRSGAAPGRRTSTGLIAVLVAAGLALPGVAAFLLRPSPLPREAPAPGVAPLSGMERPFREGEAGRSGAQARSGTEPPFREQGAAPPGSQPSGGMEPPFRDSVAAPLPSGPGPAAKGPVRVCVLRFRSLGADPALVELEEALSEAIITDVGQHPGLRIIERGQVDLPLRELDFSHSRHVAPETRARLGRIAGAEVVVIGSLQRSGNVLRAAARFVHVETGEVLDAARVEGPARTPLAVQDALAARVRELLPGLPRRLRP